MTNEQPQSKLAELLNVNSWSDEERERFLEQTGFVIVDAAIGRLLFSLRDTELAQLQARLDGATDEEDILEHLLNTYPVFTTYLQEEAVALHDEAEVVLG